MRHNQGSTRAKVNPRPWESRQERDEIGCCYPVGEGHSIQVPPGQRLTTRSVVKSEGKPSNGSPKPDGIKSVGSVLSPEKGIVVDHEDILQDVRRESRQYGLAGRQQS